MIMCSKHTYWYYCRHNVGVIACMTLYTDMTAVDNGMIIIPVCRYLVATPAAEKQSVETNWGLISDI